VAKEILARTYPLHAPTTGRTNPNERPEPGRDGSLDPFGSGAGRRGEFSVDGSSVGAGGLGTVAGSDGAVEYSTGTTTVGLVAADGVVLATDRRASLGGRFVSNKDVVKVEQVHPTAALTIAGSVGAAQAYANASTTRTPMSRRPCRPP